MEVGNPSNPETTEKIEFLIDSGAIYSVVPAPVLERLGIRPLTTQEFRLANGSKIARKKGVAVFRYGERVGGADVIFGEEGDSTAARCFYPRRAGPITRPTPARVDTTADAFGGAISKIAV
jgi:hypothetical protein